MKLKAPDAADATIFSAVNWFLGIFLATFLTIIYASSAVAKTGAGRLKPAEEWVVAQIRAGKTADLSEQFPDKGPSGGWSGPAWLWPGKS
jgi:hypothetical protein